MLWTGTGMEYFHNSPYSPKKRYMCIYNTMHSHCFLGYRFLDPLEAMYYTIGTYQMETAFLLWGKCLAPNQTFYLPYNYMSLRLFRIQLNIPTFWQSRKPSFKNVNSFSTCLHVFLTNVHVIIFIEIFQN